jgi:hypothetical protein
MNGNINGICGSAGSGGYAVTTRRNMTMPPRTMPAANEESVDETEAVSRNLVFPSRAAMS